MSVSLTRKNTWLPEGQEEYIWKVNLIRYILPVILFAFVIFFEVQEHWRDEHVMQIRLIPEVIFYGVIGPTAVFIALTYIMKLMRGLVRAREETEALNHNLEEIVAQRTAELEARNAELAMANKELQKLDQMKSDFVSMVSHELRGPLTTLNGGLEMILQARSSLPPQTKRILEVTARESQRLTQFVQTILDVSRLEAGKLPMNPGPVALHPLLHRVVDINFPDHSRPVRWHIPSDLPPLMADEVYLEEIVGNLLTNVDKYTPPKSPVELTAVVNDHCLHIMVTDFGPGVPPAYQETIFDRFRRRQEGDRLVHRGWGLGLYFARKLTEAQNGRLTLVSPVHDDPDVPGSRFIITLPLTEEVPENV